GPDNLLKGILAQNVNALGSNPLTGVDEPVDFLGHKYLDGKPVPEGWLVTPHDSPTGELSAADVRQMIQQGITEANQVRAQIRLPNDERTRMVLAVSDSQGNVLGLYRMPDATYFSIDVAVAKSRNTAYYDDPTQLLLHAEDQVPTLPAGVSM